MTDVLEKTEGLKVEDDIQNEEDGVQDLGLLDMIDLGGPNLGDGMGGMGEDDGDMMDIDFDMNLD